MNSKKSTKPLEFVICRGNEKAGIKCDVEYTKWHNPYCRKCWKKYYKGRGYIPTKEEVEKYCIE